MIRRALAWLKQGTYPTRQDLELEDLMQRLDVVESRVKLYKEIVDAARLWRGLVTNDLPEGRYYLYEVRALIAAVDRLEAKTRTRS